MKRALFVLFPILIGCAADPETIPNRPKVPGELQIALRTSNPKDGVPIEKQERWNAHETAIIICDMWDGHYCLSSAQRVGVMVPKMNAVITAARNHGVMIIHAPSGTLDQYEGTPFRKRMQQAKESKSPTPIGAWCHLDKDREPPLPIVDAKSPCDDPIVGPAVQRFTKQHTGLDIIGYDGISDNGQEIYNFCKQEGIKNIAIMGVHTNMCVLGRPFGIRQQVRNGMNVVVVRNLTDAMYDPREPPFVSHTRGTELVIEHIEKYWCPSITSDDLTRVVKK